MKHSDNQLINFSSDSQTYTTPRTAQHSSEKDPYAHAYLVSLARGSVYARISDLEGDGGDHDDWLWIKNCDLHGYDDVACGMLGGLDMLVSRSQTLYAQALIDKRLGVEGLATRD